LRQIARIFKSTCRTTDFPARYGGEEFVVLCPGVKTQEAKVLAENLRRAVEQASFPHGEAQPLGKVTVSIGVSSYPEKGQSVEEVLKAADEMLYQSKHNGRNRVS
jgi:diguanylate cyclase (GGDEF)-like protein